VVLFIIIICKFSTIKIQKLADISKQFIY